MCTHVPACLLFYPTSCVLQRTGDSMYMHTHDALRQDSNGKGGGGFGGTVGLLGKGTGPHLGVGVVRVL